MLIGNKLDIKDQRKIERNVGQNMAEDIQNDIKVKFNEEIHGKFRKRKLMKVIFGETSALSGENVSTWFGLMEDNIIKEFKDKMTKEEIFEEPGTTLKPKESEKTEKDPKKCKC